VEYILPALISSAATLLAVLLQFSLSKKKKRKRREKLNTLIKSDKIKKVIVVIKEEEEEEIIVVHASKRESNMDRVLKCSEKKLSLIVEFADEKEINYDNMSLFKNFSSELNEQI
jgi:ribonuclease HII